MNRWTERNQYTPSQLHCTGGVIRFSSRETCTQLCFRFFQSQISRIMRVHISVRTRPKISARSLGRFLRPKIEQTQAFLDQWQSHVRDVCSSGNVGTTPAVHRNFRKWIKLANSVILLMQIDNKTCVKWRPVKFYGTQPGNIILKNTRTLSWRHERSLCCHNQAFGRAFARSSQH